MIADFIYFYQESSPRFFGLNQVITSLLTQIVKSDYTPGGIDYQGIMAMEFL